MKYNRLINHFDNLIEQKKIRSAAFCIAENGTVVSCNATGEMDLGDGLIKTVSTDTIFEIQSITKWITATAILILMERGFLSLSDYASRYITEFKQNPFNKITIMHLLTHTSGLVPHDGTFPERNLNWRAYINNENVAGSWIPAILKMGLYHEPGTTWEYSMIGFCILGEIISRITGDKAKNFIRSEILIPCEMTETHWKCETTPELSGRYQVRTDRHRKQYSASKLSGYGAWIDYCAGWPEIPETAGGLMSTLRDIIQFGIMLSQGGNYKNRQILHESSIKLFEKNQLNENVRDFCWNHGGIRIAYGAGCATHYSSFDKTMQIGEQTLYHEGTGPCMLMVNRKGKFTAVWNTPFFSENDWYAEPIKDTANIIWNSR